MILLILIVLGIVVALVPMRSDVKIVLLVILAVVAALMLVGVLGPSPLSLRM